jgi:prevent-host-death family protein
MLKDPRKDLARGVRELATTTASLMMAVPFVGGVFPILRRVARRCKTAIRPVRDTASTGRGPGLPGDRGGRTGAGPPAGSGLTRLRTKSIILPVARRGPTTVNVHEAKTHLSRLLARVEAGQEVVIARAGRPVARLVPVGPSPPERTLGLDRGRVVIADDFDATLPEEVLRGFEGEDPA